MVRAVRFHGFGGPEVLRIEDIRLRPPAQDEVQIRVRAIGLNRAEVLMRSGSYIETPTFPAGLGLEAAGVIEAIGHGVERLAPGDAVSIIPPKSMIPWPTYSQVLNIPANQVVQHPASLGWEGAAALWMAYLTAYGMLVDAGGLEASDTVIITASTSSVGLAALQIAKHLGAMTIAVTRTAGKVAPLLAAGADHAVVAGDDLREHLLAHTGADGARIVLDPVGGPLMTELAAAMSYGGTLFAYGGLSKAPTLFPTGAALSRMLTIRGYLVHAVTGTAEKLERAKAFILNGLNSGALQPTIDRVFPFDQIADAHRYLEANDHFGKVVVTL